MWELDYKESWVPKNWCFWPVVLEKTSESPLDCKEIQPVHPKRDQSWVFIGRTDAETETPILWPLDELTHLKRPWCWERLKAGREGNNKGGDGWMASPTRWTWVWAAPGAGDEQGSPVCCSPRGCKESDTTEGLIWSDLLLENPRPLSPWGPPDFLSTCLGIDSLNLWMQRELSLKQLKMIVQWTHEW